MSGLKINILRTFIMAILIMVFVLGFTYVRFFVLLILACMLFVELLRKKLRCLVTAALLVCLYFSMMPSRFPFMFQLLERIRFGILQSLYANEVENVLADYPDNMDYQFIEGCNWILTSHGKADYQRDKSPLGYGADV